MPKKVAIIGGGIFGSTIALDLAKNTEFEITLFEREKDLLLGASSTNLLRHHYGYHYPRSEKTAKECQEAIKSFEEEYKECISEEFPSYYAIIKEGSKSTAKEYLNFCDKLSLPYKIEWPKEELMDRAQIELCLKTPEPVYDPDKLRKVIKEKLKKTKIKIRYNSEIIDAKIDENTKKILKIKSENKVTEEEFDYIIGALYSNFNQLNKWFKFPKQQLRYSLFEVLEIELPINYKIGMIIVDGDFSALLPNGNKSTFRLANAKESVIKRVISDNLDDSIIKDLKENKSNEKEILEVATKYFPIVKKARVVKKFYIIQVVKANVESTDERPSEITDRDKGIFSIFSGKVVNCVSLAKKLTEILKEKNEK